MEEIEEVAALGAQINIDNLSILEQFGKTSKRTGLYSKLIHM